MEITGLPLRNLIKLPKSRNHSILYYVQPWWSRWNMISNGANYIPYITHILSTSGWLYACFGNGNSTPEQRFFPQLTGRCLPGQCNAPPDLWPRQQYKRLLYNRKPICTCIYINIYIGLSLLFMSGLQTSVEPLPQRKGHSGSR